MTPAVRSCPPVCLFRLLGNILFQKLTCSLCPPVWLEEMQRNKRAEAEGSSSLRLSPKEEDACGASPVRGRRCLHPESEPYALMKSLTRDLQR